MKNQNIDPPRARLLIVPAYGDHSFLCDKEGVVLHTTALVGSIPGPEDLAPLYQYQRPFFCHEDEECKKKLERRS